VFPTSSLLPFVSQLETQPLAPATRIAQSTAQTQPDDLELEQSVADPPRAHRLYTGRLQARVLALAVQATRGLRLLDGQAIEACCGGELRCKSKQGV